MKISRFLIFLIVMLFYWGCTSVGVNLIDQSKRYPPTKNALLLFETPDKDYEVIAIIEGKGGKYKNGSQVIESMRKKAQKVGAHALLLNNTSKQYVEPTNVTNPISSGPPIHITGWNKLLATGHAIRFLE